MSTSSAYELYKKKREKEEQKADTSSAYDRFKERKSKNTLASSPETAKNVYNYLTGGGYADVETVGRYKNELNDHLQSISNVREGYLANAANYDQEEYRKALSNLKDNENYFKTLLEGLEDFGTFENESGYNNFYYQNRYAGKTYEEIQEARKTATGDEKAFLESYGENYGHQDEAYYNAEIAGRKKAAADIEAKMEALWAENADIYQRLNPYGQNGLHGIRQPQKEQQRQKDQQRQKEIRKELEALSAEAEANASGIERLENARRGYERDNVYELKYAEIAEKEDFDAVSNQREFSNPTKEDFLEWDNLQSGGIGNKFDENGNLVYVDIAGNIYDENWEANHKPVVEDKLGIFLSADKADLDFAVNSSSLDTNSYLKLLNEGQNKFWSELKEDEIGVYYYLLNNEGQEKAYQYLEEMEPVLGRRVTEEGQAQIAKADAFSKTLLNIASVPASIYGGVIGFIDDAANILQGKETNPYSRAHSLANFASAVREETAKDIAASTSFELFGQNVPEFLYQTAMSIADSALGAATLGKGYTVFMGMTAATNEAKRLYEQGADSSQIVAGSILAGVAEAVAEKLPLDNLLSPKNIHTVKQWALEALKQAWIEGTEETLTEIANTVTNSLVMGANSDLSDAINAYMQQGMTEEEAKNQAIIDKAADVGWAALGGFLSGDVMGGAVGGVNYVQNARDDAQSGKDFAQLPEANLSLAEEILSKPDRYSAETVRLAESIKERASAQKKVSNRKAGQLYNTAVAETNRNTVQRVKDGITAQLESSGESQETAQKLGEIVYKQFVGKELTGREKRQFYASETAQKVYAELSGKSKAEVLENKDLRAIDRAVRYRAATRKATGDAVSVDGENPVASVENSEIKINTSEGVVSASELDLGYEKGYILDKGKRAGMTAEEINKMAASYDPDVKCESYAADYTDVYTAARMGRTREMARQMLGDRLQISEAVFNEAYELGLARRNAYIEEKAAAQEAATEKAKQENGGKIKARKGRVRVEGGTENAAQNDGSVIRYSSDDNTSGIKQQLRNNLDKVNAHGSVYDFEISKMTAKEAERRAIEEFKKIGFKVDRKDFGIIEIGEKQIKKAFDYLRTSGEYAALMAVPKVLKRGILISEHSNHKGRYYPTMTIAAQVHINGKAADIAVVVRRTGKNNYYTHRVLMPDGSEFVFENEKNTEPTPAGVSTSKGIQWSANDSVSNNNVPQSGTVVNSDSMQDKAEYSDKLPTADAEQRKNGYEQAEGVTEVNDEEDVIERSSIDPTFEAEYDRWNKKDPRVVFTIGTTSKALQSLGVADKTISWDSSKIIKIRAKHSEMTDDIIKQVPDILENPIVVMQSKQNQSRMTMFGEVYVGSKPILAVLELHPTRKGGIQLDELKIASAYGKDNAQAFIDSSTILYKDSNKKRVSIWEKRTGLQLPVGFTNANSNNNIPQSGTVVNSHSMQAEEKYSTATPEQKKKGDVRVEGDVKIVSPQQLAIKKFAELLAEMTGIDIVLYSNAKKGKMAGKYGLYRHFKDGSRDEIWINLNAGSRGGRLIRATMAHELTHFMAEHNPREYEIYKNFLFEQIGAQRANELVQKHMDRGETEDVAIEEVVAELSENMLDNGTAIRKLAETDLTTAQKIKAWIDNFLQKFLDAFEKATGRHTDLLAEAKVDLEQMQKLFDQTLAKAVEHYNAGVKKGNHSAQTVERYSEIGVAEDGKKIYESNFPKGTPKSAKSKRILDYIRNLWSKKPIKLIISNGEISRTILAKFDPTIDESQNIPTDASKIAGGNRHGSHAEQRVTLDLADDYYQIASESKYNYSKLETGKTAETHSGVNMWHYFVNDIYFAEYGEKTITPYTVTINVKEKDDGNFVYSFNAEKESSTRRTLHAGVNTPKGANGELFYKDNVPQSGTVVNSHSMQTSEDYSDNNSTAVLTEREILSDAFAQLAQTSAEKESLTKYREAVSSIEECETRLAEVKREIKEKSFAKGKRDLDGLQKLKDEKIRLENKLNYWDQRLIKIEAAKPLRELFQRATARASKKARAEGREALAEYREKRNQRDAIEKIKYLKADIEKRLLHPTDGKHVPSYLVEAMVRVCNALSFDTDRTDPDGNPTKAQERRHERIAALNQLSRRYSKLQTDDHSEYSYEYDKTIQKMIDDLIDEVDNTRVRDMSTEQLYYVHSLLKSISLTLQDATKLIGDQEKRTILESALKIKTEQEQLDGHHHGLIGSLAVNLLSPMRAIRWMSGYDEDSELMRLTKALNEGVHKKEEFTMRTLKKMEPVLADRKRLERAMKEERDFGFRDKDGNPILANDMVAMEAYLALLRELKSNDKIQHIRKGGIFIPATKPLANGNLEKAMDQGREAVFDPLKLGETVASLEGKFDDWMRAYVNTAREIFNVDSKQAVNSVSMKLKHRLVATEDDYIPFTVDKKQTTTEIDINEARDTTIASYGFVKKLKEGSLETIVMTGLDRVLDKHIDLTGNIYGLAIPVHNFQKVWQAKTGDGAKNIQATLSANWGGKGITLIEKMVSDLQAKRVIDHNDIVKVIDKATGTFAYGAIQGNAISVALKQLAAIPTAYGILDYRNGATAMATFARVCKNYNQLIKEVDQDTAILFMRRQGLSFKDIQNVRGSFAFAEKVEKKVPAKFNVTKWVQGVDILSCLTMYEFAKQDVKKYHPDLEVGSEEYRKKVTELFTKVIDETQQNSSVMHRAEVFKTPLLRAFTMFKTQSFQQAGMIYDAFGNYVAKRKQGKEQKAKALKQLYKACYANVLSQLWFTALGFIVKALLHRMNRYRDEEDELTLESISKELFFGEFLPSLLEALIPFGGSELLNFTGGNFYGEDAISDPTLSYISDFVKTIASTAQDLKEGDLSWDSAKELIIQFANIFQIPVKPFFDVIEAIQLHCEDIANGEFLSFEAGVDRSNAQEVTRYGDAILAADRNGAKTLMNEMLEEAEKTSLDSLEQKVSEGRASYSKSQMKTEASGAARTTIKSAFTGKYKEEYFEAYQARDADRVAEIRRILEATGLYENVLETFEEWRKDWHIVK